MKFLRVLRHIGIIAAGVILMIGVPLWCTGYITSLFSDSADVVSSASVVLDQPSGEFVVLINKELHKNQENLDKWIKFFSGDVAEDEILVIFEDVSCSVAETDSTGVDLAESFRSQLPENQMQVKQEDVTLVASRADNGFFDILVMSKEFADAYSLETAYGDNVQVINVVSSDNAEGEEPANAES